MAYPTADERLVGTFDVLLHAGGGDVWDAVLEYRVWLHPHDGAPDEANGNNSHDAVGTCRTIPDFLAPDALEILRGDADD